MEAGTEVEHGGEERMVEAALELELELQQLELERAEARQVSGEQREGRSLYSRAATSRSFDRSAFLRHTKERPIVSECCVAHT